MRQNSVKVAAHHRFEGLNILVFLENDVQPTFGVSPVGGEQRTKGPLFSRRDPFARSDLCPHDDAPNQTSPFWGQMLVGKTLSHHHRQSHFFLSRPRQLACLDTSHEFGDGIQEPSTSDHGTHSSCGRNVVLVPQLFAHALSPFHSAFTSTPFEHQSPRIRLHGSVFGAFCEKCVQTVTYFGGECRRVVYSLGKGNSLLHAQHQPIVSDVDGPMCATSDV